jgi:type III restriction enzyme
MSPPRSDGLLAIDIRFLDKLTGFEAKVMAEELGRDEVRHWFRNPPRKKWSFQVPWQERKGIYKPVFPDLLIFREVDGQVVIDILDPHTTSLRDAIGKAHGLAWFAERHKHHFGRIELIDEIDGNLRRLDLRDDNIRALVLTAESNDALVEIYKASGH